MYRLDRRNKLLSYGKAHYFFEVDGKRYAFCYIRKNACSAFKKLICDTSKEADFANYSGSVMQYLEAYHRIRSVDQLQSCDHAIFVIRDPYERLISAYVNKFVVQTGNEEIFRSFETHMGMPAQEATFRIFVKDYCRSFRDKDMHVFPQHGHLVPWRYDSVLKISELYEDIFNLMGQKIADKYFSRKENFSQYGMDAISIVDVPCGELNAEYQLDKKLPSKQSLQDERLEEIIMNRYQLDYQILGKMRKVPPSNFPDNLP